MESPDELKNAWLVQGDSSSRTPIIPPNEKIVSEGSIDYVSFHQIFDDFSHLPASMSKLQTVIGDYEWKSKELILFIYLCINVNSKELFDMIVKENSEVFDKFQGEFQKYQSFTNIKDFNFFQKTHAKQLLVTHVLQIAADNKLDFITEKILNDEPDVILTDSILASFAKNKQAAFINKFVLKGSKKKKYINFEQALSHERVHSYEDFSFQDAVEIMSSNPMISDHELMTFMKENCLILRPNTLEVLLKSQRLEVLKLMNPQNSTGVISSQTLIYSINSNNFILVFQNFRLFHDHLIAAPTLFIDALVNSTGKSFHHIESKLFLLKFSLDYMNYNQCRQLLGIVGNTLEPTDFSEEKIELAGFLYYASNPLKITVLMIELVRKIMAQYKSLKYLGKAIAQRLVNIGMSFINSVKDDLEFRTLFLDVDFEGRELIVLIQKLKLVKFLNSAHSEKIVDSFWKSKYIITGSTVDMSTSHQLLKLPLSSYRDREAETRFTPPNQEDRRLPVHSYHYKVWKKGMRIRYIIQALLMLGMAIYFQYQISDMLDQNKQVREDTATHKASIESADDSLDFGSMGDDDKSSNMQSIYDDNPTLYSQRGTIVSNSETMASTIFTLGYSSLVFSILFIETFFESIFISKARRFYSIFSMERLLYFLAFISAVIHLILVNQFWSDSEDYDILDDLNSREVRFVKNYDDDDQYAKEILSIFMASLWLLVLMSFQISKIIGPLIKMFQAMIYDIIVFLILFVLQLLTFACIGNILFLSSSSYTDLVESLVTLFSASLGGFDYTTFDEFNTFKKSIGRIFLTIFLIINMILALNLLIAILSTTYSLLQEKTTGLFLLSRIKCYPKSKHSKKYSSLVNIPFPLSGLLIFVGWIPTILGTEKANEVVLHIEYFPLGLIFGLIFFCYNLLLLPFVYIKMVIFKIALLTRQNRDSRSKKIVQLFLYLFFGVIILVGETFYDTKNFFIYLYRKDLPKLYDRPTFDVLTPDEANLLFNTFSNQKTKQMQMDDAIDEESGVVTLQWAKNLLSKITPSRNMAIDNFVERNSIEIKRRKFFLCNQISSILESSKYWGTYYRYIHNKQKNQHSNYQLSKISDEVSNSRPDAIKFKRNQMKLLQYINLGNLRQTLIPENAEPDNTEVNYLKQMSMNI